MSAAAVVNELLETAYADMDRDGMFPADWTCTRCGKVLNADGGHPAELYAGTYNGMCYRCTSGAKYITGTRLIDGGTVWSHPPHLPSWRRDRETYVFYWDCDQCHGEGRRATWDNTAGCDACSKRSYTYGPGHDHTEFRRRAMRAAEARFERRVTAHLKLPKRISKKRRTEAFVALKDDHPDTWDELQNKTLAEYRRVDAAVSRRAERRATYTVLSPHDIVTALLHALRFT